MTIFTKIRELAMWTLHVARLSLVNSFFFNISTGHSATTAKLAPDEQQQVWRQAVETAGGKVPSERIVKAEVLRYQGKAERLMEKNPPHPEFALGEVVKIKAARHSPLRPFSQMWGIIEHVGSFSYTVRISIVRDLQQCKGEEMTRVDDEYTADIKFVGQRIAALIQFELEPIEYDLIANLQRSKCFTPTQLQLLEWLEQKHLADYSLQGDKK